MGAIEPPLVWVQRDRHERVLEVQDKREHIFAFDETLTEEGEIDTMIYASRKNLPLGQGHRTVDPVGSEILDQTMLEGAVFLQFGHVAQRGRVALGPQVLLGRLYVRE